MAAGTFQYGSDLWLGFGEESAWGTAVARTFFLKPVSAALKADVQYGESAQLYGLSRSNVYERGRRASADVSFELAYSGYTKLLKHLLGNVSSSTMTAGQSYKHQIARATSLPAGLSIEEDRGVKNRLFSGMQLAQASLRWTPRDIMTIALTFVGKTGVDNTGSESTPIFISTERQIYASDVTVLWGATDITEILRSIELTITNNLNTERFVIGSLTPKVPTRSGISDVRWRLEMEQDSTLAWGLWTDFMAGTERLLKLTADSGDDIGTSSDHYLLMIETPKAKCTMVDDGVSDKGVIPQSVELTTRDALDTDYSVDSNQAGDIKITVQNDEATV